MDEKELTKIYRDWMKKELTRPELAREKKDFVSAHFREEVPSVPLGSFAPALALLIFCFILIKVQPIILPPVAYTDRQKIPDDETFAHPAVEVKRVTSKVGTTMVYQKTYEGKLITIVWVFVP